MKVVILAGGYGTRISEESYLKPKPMIEIGSQPILWHIMKSYSYYGYNDFVICCGYKANVIKEYFSNYFLHRSDVTFDFKTPDKIIIHNTVAEPWTVTVVDTGLDTMTGGRLKRVQSYIDDDIFMLTYGDGVCDLNVSQLEKFHREHNKMVTITAVRPGSRFGTLEIAQGGMVSRFAEKREEDGGWINGGYMVMNPEIFNHISSDCTILEKEPLEYAANSGNLRAFMHDGFWACMDTMRDKLYLEELLNENNAPWKVWRD